MFGRRGTSVSGVVEQHALFPTGRTMAHGHVILTAYPGPVLHKPAHKDRFTINTEYYLTTAP